MGKKAEAAENIKVLVRCRPLSEKEKHNGYKSCVELDTTENRVTVKSTMGNPDRYTFDAVINNSFTQKDIFIQYIQPLVDCVLDGFNATVFAYGQSGSGKTHTMTGVMNNEELEGVIPRCVSHIFSSVKEKKTTEPNKSFSMYVSFVELYNGKVRDLLAKQQVTLDVRENKDHTFFVQGASVPQVKIPEDIFRLMEQGTERRKTAATELNADSSRSHSLFTLILECTEMTDNGALSVTSKLNLVDLAGSERQGKTGATGETLQEGCSINLSLSALGTVIDTIVKGKGHIPFRSSQLTMLLKDSLGGNSKTVMFANINPSEHNLSETVSTLRFADRAKQIKNKPVVNMDSKDQKIAELSAMVQEMKEKLQQFETGGVAALEQELEELREREGDLKVKIDNAVKGRQADAVDFENAKAKFALETQSFNAQLVEQEEQIVKLKNDLQIAETRVSDGLAQATEILQICTTYLRPDNPFVDADDLQRHLREMTSDGGALSSSSRVKDTAEVAQLQAKIQSLEAENQTVKKEMKSKVKEMKERREEDKKSIHHAEAKIKKLQAEVKAAKEREKSANDARVAAEGRAAAAAASAVVATAAAAASLPSGGAAADGGSAPSSHAVVPPPLAVQDQPPVTKEELKVVKKAIETFEKKNIVNSEEFKKADARMEDLQRQHREVQNGVGHELSSLKKHLASRVVEGDQAEVIKELQDLVKQSDTTIASLMAEVATSHQLLANMRAVMKKTGMVPLSVVKGDPKVAQESLEALTTVEEQATGVQGQILEKVAEGLSRTTEQRNRLLSAMCEGEGTADMRVELNQLIEENKQMHDQQLTELKEINESISHTMGIAAQKQIADPASPALSFPTTTAPTASAAGPVAPNAAETPASPAAEPPSAKGDKKGKKGSRSSSKAPDKPASPRQSSKEGSTAPQQDGGAEAAATTTTNNNVQLQQAMAELEAKKAKYKEEVDMMRQQLHDVRSEMESLKGELAEEQAARESQESFKEKLYEELQRQREEISREERKNAELQAKLTELSAQYQQKVAERQHKESEVQDLEKRLEKRSEQLNQLRELLETQKTLIVRSNEKIDYYQQKLKESEQVTQSTKAHFERLLEEKDESVQRIINQRMVDYSEACKQETNQKQGEIKKLKKKIKKLQSEMVEQEEEFDKLVITCEELRTELSEQKVQHLKKVREFQLDHETVQVIESNEKIQNSLEKSKHERKLREDRFAMGEVQNVKSGLNRSMIRSRESDASDASR